MVSLVTGCTAPFATSSIASKDALILVFLSSSRKALLMNWCNVSLDTPARGGLTLALPYTLLFYLGNDVSAAAAASCHPSALSWVTGMGAGLPVGLVKWYVYCSSLASAGLILAGILWFAFGGSISASISFWIWISAVILIRDTFYMVSLAAYALFVDCSCSCSHGPGPVCAWRQRR